MISTVTEKPSRWNRRSNAPYYRERYALEIKHILDEMMLACETGDIESRMLKYDNYQDISHITLYLRINQAMLYLLERMDTPDKMYARFRSLISISRIRSVGIRFSYLHGDKSKPLEAFKVSNLKLPEPKLVAPTILPSPKEDWKASLHAFVEKAEAGQNIKINNLNLTAEDGEYIKNMIPEDKCIIYKATADSLFAARLTPEQYAKAK